MSPVRSCGFVVGLICACVALAASTQPNTITVINEQDVDGPRVYLKQGQVLGAVEKSLHNKPFFSFKGIPYARPPVGLLRFKPPKPIAENRTAVINATKEGSDCIQVNYLQPGPLNVHGCEDCLYLNVYTPKIDGKKKFPVMVYIHGGGWFTGSGASYIVGPRHLLDQNVVLVTFNYRLGAFGFLSTGDKAATGNYAMKDQVQVLKWVKENILAFRGDNQLVTIFGQSAGAASAHYHMLSPLSKGLFQHVISQSGTALSPWGWPSDALEIAREQGRLVNCSKDSSTDELIECLRKIDATTLVLSGHGFHKWSIDPVTTFTPVVETEDPNPFLTEDPLKIIRAGKFAKVPWMMGVVAQEGIIRAVPIVSNDLLLKQLNSKFKKLAPFLLELSKSVPEHMVDELRNNITKFYLKNASNLNPNNEIGFIDVYSDRGFVHGVHKSALLQAARGHENIFMYQFNYRPVQPVSYQYTLAPTIWPTSYGVSHCDDLLYLFDSPILLNELPLFNGWPSKLQDQHVVKALVKLWTNFARHGNPTPTNASSARLSCRLEDKQCNMNGFKWQPMPANGSATQTTYLYIRNGTSAGYATLHFSMEVGLFQKRMDFWDQAPLQENSDSLNATKIAKLEL